CNQMFSRLQDGIKFLHAYQLCRKPGDSAADAAADGVRMSNLYGIQISSQLASKDTPGVPKAAAASRAAPEPRSQLALAVGLDAVPQDHQQAALRNICSVTSADDSDVSGRIKQERVEEEDGEAEDEGPQGGSPLFKGRPLLLQCPRCGERCSSPEDLREHLFSHALDPEALRQSQVLANQLAAELRRSRGDGDGGTSPAPTVLHSRKRKIACAVCSLRFSHKSQLQEHMYSHTGKPGRFHRYNRLCSQLFQGSAHFCDAAGEPGGGGGASAALCEDANRDTQDNGSSCYSLDSEVSQESVDGVPVE
uniref:Zinc finger and BTB domain containing 25 n=1 Tax=Poecilia reticulata TaxID=8081 RepID=A0A3P9PC97_POERE